MKRFFFCLTMIFAGLCSYAQQGLHVNELFEGRIIPQERMVETRVRGKTLAKYHLSYYRSLRFTASEEEAERVRLLVEEDGKGLSGSWLSLSEGRSNSKTYKVQVRKTDDKNCFLCCQTQWKGNQTERHVTVIYMEGSIDSLQQLEEVLKSE